jgi:nitronate monooxygenase
MNSLLRKLGIGLPIIQAPMAGTSTPALAAAVSNAGGLGSLGVGAMSAGLARAAIAETRAATNRPFNVNVFCHRPPEHEPEREAGWIARLAPEFARFGAQPPKELREVYKTFVNDEAMFEMLLLERPAVISFHFGLPPPAKIAALRAAGTVLLASATSLTEARAAQAAGIDAVVAQGYEAGGHRGIFEPAARDEHLGTLALTRLLVKEMSIPVIAAGGIMDGAGIAACLFLGASAAQLGTAFIACPETAADAAYRSALLDRSVRTVMTTAISGRPARCIVNAFTALGERFTDADVAPYPMAYDAGKALIAAAKAKGETGYGAQWAGQGAALARALPADTLMAVLETELKEALARPPALRANPL